MLVFSCRKTTATTTLNVWTFLCSSFHAAADEITFYFRYIIISQNWISYFSHSSGGKGFDLLINLDGHFKNKIVVVGLLVGWKQHIGREDDPLLPIHLITVSMIT